MIELYTWTTPNGRKASIALEEVGLAYEVRVVDLGRGAQRKPEFLALSPLGRIPAIIDADGPGGQPLRLFESGAILLYLAEKTGKLMPADLRGRARVTAWLMVQLTDLGPALGQLVHPPGEEAAAKARQQADRVLEALDARLAEAAFVADDYSIADIAFYPWIEGAERRGLIGERHAHLRRWLADVGGRPAVRRGMAVPAAEKA